MHPTDERESPCRVTATDRAAEALERLRAEHGAIVLHLPGGAEDAGTPVCLPADELRIGQRDLYLGTVHGVDLYEQVSLPGQHYRSGWAVLLDLVPGRSVGFSLMPADGMRFTIRDTAPPDRT